MHPHSVCGYNNKLYHVGTKRHEEKVQKTRNSKRSERSNVNVETVTNNAYENRQAMNHRYPVPVPEVITVDDLAIMSDEDIMARLRTLEDDKNKIYEAYLDARPWEEEIAYIRREQQIRRVRRDANTDYMKRVENEFNAAEVGLPSGDFDNTNFVNAANGGRPRWN